MANVIWNQRMLELDGERRYADMLELSLFNGALTGISLDACSYFYINPLSVAAHQRRSDWFACACCPPNIARLIASIAGHSGGRPERRSAASNRDFSPRGS